MSKSNTKKRPHSGSDDCTSTEPKKGHWSLGLLDSLDDPQYFVKSDDLMTVIKDKYPKAEFHYLVIPKENIPSLKKVTYSHLSLLKHMEHIAKDLTIDTQDRNFKIGYHAEPSMFRLHLHVISDDMNSPCLKTKKHWNSYNTDFFLDSKSNNLITYLSFNYIIARYVAGIISQLEETKNLGLPSSTRCKELLQTPLKCNKCSFIPKHIPALKKHLLTHI